MLLHKSFHYGIILQNCGGRLRTMPKGVGCVWLPFNFGNIYFIPSTDAYVEHEYTIARNHLMLTSEHTVKDIEQH